MASESKKRRTAHAAILRGIPPHHIEAVAKWIDASVSNYPETVSQLAAVVAANPGHDAARGQLEYQRRYWQCARHLASVLRQMAQTRDRAES